ncbi:MAG: hypothetical protein KDA75_08135, partial [Planctomycetaceae bacterium]|nr:hypothetical protein [Planctomycetaceae bacterium]
LFRWDNHIEPAVHEPLVSSVDVVPTILAAAGLASEIPDLPGHNLLPSATGAEPLEDRPVFGEIYPGDATTLGHPSGDIAYRWVRRGEYKLIVPQAHNGQPPWGDYLAEPALFNVVHDPQEQHNLIGDRSDASLQAELQTLLDDWWQPGNDAAVQRPTID